MEDETVLDRVTTSGYLQSVYSQTVCYKGYYGIMEVDVKTDSIYGRVLYIRGLITFQATTVRQAKIEFAKSVDDYIEFCKELNKEPN